jgi:hypothetical protein
MSTSDRTEVSIIIVSYNTREMTIAAIDSVVAETTETSYEIIVVDNASTDGSAAAIAAHPAKPRLIALNENIGFGRANNLAAEEARGYYVLLLNSDTLVRDRAIDTLVRFARANRRAMIWGGRTIFADGRLNPGSCWRQITPWNLACRIAGLTAALPRSGLFNSEAYGGWNRDSVREVDIVSGCFLLIPRSIWLALGGFDPKFFMYGEDADLCLRARRLGARPRITPAATIVHHGGASERVPADKLIKLLAAKASLIERHWPLPLRSAGQLFLSALPLTRWIGYAVQARLTGSATSQANADMYKEVWDNRVRWRFGYAKSQPIAAEIAAAAPMLPRLHSMT